MEENGGKLKACNFPGMEKYLAEKQARRDHFYYTRKSVEGEASDT
jgi:hypothetical protein